MHNICELEADHFGDPLFFSIDVLGQEPLSQEIHQEEGDADRQQGAADDEENQVRIIYVPSDPAEVDNPDRQEDHTQQAGHTGTGQASQQPFLERLLVTRALEKFSVYRGAVFQRLQHDLRLAVGLVPPYAADQPDDHDRQDNTNADRD